MPELKIYVAKSYKDKPLKGQRLSLEWVVPIQAGAALTGERVAGVLDSSGNNISDKNANYCELTALYWIWKNCLDEEAVKAGGYYGLYHYRRWLDFKYEDFKNICAYGADVVLPFPTIHEPDIREHHARYVKEGDWEAVLQALKELQPEYYLAYERIFSQKYFYNYNILVARADILKKYCEWLFPVLEKVERLTVPKGSERGDRYIGYIGENLLTLYFMYHSEEMKIVHTGRMMLT